MLIVYYLQVPCGNLGMEVLNLGSFSVVRYVWHLHDKFELLPEAEKLV